MYSSTTIFISCTTVDVPGGLEDALIVPIGVRGFDEAAQAVVFAEEQGVDRSRVDGGVRALAAEREQRRLPFGGERWRHLHRVWDAAELRLALAVRLEQMRATPRLCPSRTAGGPGIRAPR